MIGELVSLIIALVVLGFIYWAVGLVPFIAGPFKRILLALIALIAVLVILFFLLGLLGISTPSLR